MTISSGSVFHHTRKLSSLKSILKTQTFKVQYSTEKIYVNNKYCLHIAVPMVSFCDIPLTDYKNYFRKKRSDNPKIFKYGYYGDFGIALKKEWAIKNGICPIIYIPKVKEDFRKTNSLLNLFKSSAVEKIDANNLGMELHNCNSLTSYIKHYEGYLDRINRSKKVVSENYCFYNEREWRFVPSDTPILWNFYNDLTDTFGKTNKIKTNKALKIPLAFSIFKDVSLIIVKKDDNIPDIVNILKDLKEKSEFQFEKKLQILCSKIVTTEQLMEDF